MLIIPGSWLVGAVPLNSCGGLLSAAVVASTSATVSIINFRFSSITTCGEASQLRVWFGDLGEVAELLLKCQTAGIIQFAAVSRGGGFPADARRGKFGPLPYGSLVFNGCVNFCAKSSASKLDANTDAGLLIETVTGHLWSNWLCRTSEKKFYSFIFYAETNSFWDSGIYFYFLFYFFLQKLMTHWHLWKKNSFLCCWTRDLCFPRLRQVTI